ncbi:SRPBCC family protein, partial [Oleiphilus sp. HI0066]|uniref:SRPBCC family protein n=2 Tax=Oleiphilus TaxID=141450 RepID=UPI0007C3CD3F
MAFKVNIDVDRTITVSADVATAFALLSDVPASAEHFPKIENLIDQGDGVYRWETEKVGIGDHALQTIYASKYVSDEANGSVEWTAVKGEGNAQVSGGWSLTEVDGGTELTLSS